MSDSNQAQTEQPPVIVDEKGPWPVVTRRVFHSADGRKLVWSSRHHRKSLLIRGAAEAEGIALVLLRCLWMPGRLNWWIGAIFAIGSLLFAWASILCLAPALARALSLDMAGINAIFFAGSIPFTIAAYLQLFQAANAGDYLPDGPRSPRRTLLFGWRPHDIGWLSCALQFMGTILFNLNTFDAMLPALKWFEEDLVIWAPNIFGSIFFLASGYMAFIEICHGHWAWKPKSISWWVVFTNLLGCVGFMLSAPLAIALPGAESLETLTFSVLFTLIGALHFFTGSVLMIVEEISPGEH